MDWNEWKSFRKGFLKEFGFEFVLVRDFLFWVITIAVSVVFWALARVLTGADWNQIYFGIKASAWIFTVFYLMKLVMELANILADRWSELRDKLMKLWRPK